MTSDGSEFYPSDSWAVAIDGFLELGGVVHEQDGDDDITLPWGEGPLVTVTALRSNTLVFGSRRVSASYRPLGLFPGDQQLVDDQPRVHWFGGDRDFSDQVWKWMGEVVRGDVVGPGEMDNTWKEQILDAPGWREYRSNWKWVHCPWVKGPVCDSCGGAVVGNDRHLRMPNGRCSLLVNLLDP